MKENLSKNQIYVVSILTILILASFGVNIYLYYLLNIENKSLLSTVEKYEETVDIIQTKLSSTTLEKEQVAINLQKEKEYTNLFQNQIQNLAGTVGVLEKLSKTDTELLKKYSKVYFLNENYIPKELVQIPEQYIYEKNKKIEIHAKVWPHLQSLLDSANADGVKIQIASGYRSYGTQAGLKSTYKVTYGAGTANSFSADQGYSEHQLGTTVDFTSPEINGNLSGFEKTKSYDWLLRNAYKYGFILSYPKGNKYYVYEPWHWRYVSTGLSTSLNNDKINFYDMEQRVIDSYLVNFFD